MKGKNKESSEKLVQVVQKQ